MRPRHKKTSLVYLAQRHDALLRLGDVELPVENDFQLILLITFDQYYRLLNEPIKERQWRVDFHSIRIKATAKTTYVFTKAQVHDFTLVVAIADGIHIIH